MDRFLVCFWWQCILYRYSHFGKYCTELTPYAVFVQNLYTCIFYNHPSFIPWLHPTPVANPQGAFA
jgi:hypothetical protein